MTTELTTASFPLDQTTDMGVIFRRAVELDAHIGGNVGFEVFDKRTTPLAKAPSVTIQKRGVISMNKAAHELLSNAETVELLFDRERQIMAIRATDDSSPHAYAVRNGSARGPGQAVVSATAFTAHYGIDTTVTRRWKPFLEEGMLCVDLTTFGTVITGNRTKKPTPETLEAPGGTPTEYPEATDD